MSEGGCLHGDGVIVCRPRTYNWRTRRNCPTCGRLRWFLVAEAVWYGATLTCLGCGDAWSEGERLSRPFARGWRESAIRSAKGRPYTTKKLATEALMAEVKVYVDG